MYIKVTDDLPEKGQNVLTFNGEHEINNEWLGSQWKYKMKYPMTHWTPKPELPTIEEVIEVRKQINGE